MNSKDISSVDNPPVNNNFPSPDFDNQNQRVVISGDLLNRLAEGSISDEDFVTAVRQLNEDIKKGIVKEGE
jgi:hypothetical protein